MVLLLTFTGRERIEFLRKILILILLLAVFITDIYLLNLSEFNNDEASWALYAMNSLKNKRLPACGRKGSIDIYQGLFAAYLYIGLFSLFGYSMNAIGVFLISLHLLSILILYLLTKRMYNVFTAILSCLFYITAPIFVNFYSLKGNDYCFYFIPLTITIYSLHKIVNDSKLRYLVLLAISAGIATQCHSSAYFIIPAVLIILLLNFNNLKKNGAYKAYIFLSLLIFLIFIGYHVYSILINKGAILSYLRPNNNMLITSKKILQQVAVIDNLKRMYAPSFRKSYFLLFDYNVLLIILFLLLNFAKPINSNFKRNDHFLFIWILATFFSFIIACYYFNHNPDPIFAVFFPAVYIAQASFLNKIYLNAKSNVFKKGVIFFAVFAISANAFISLLGMKFIRKTGGIGWHRPTRSVRVAVIDYILSRDNKPNIVLVGDPREAWWSHPPYKFILETTRPKAGMDANLSFYIVEEKSMWYKPVFNEKIKNINVMDEKIIGSVKIIISRDFYPDAGMILESPIGRR